MATLEISITLPAGTAPDRKGERSVLNAMLESAIRRIGGGSEMSGELTFDGATLGGWTYTPVSNQ